MPFLTEEKLCMMASELFWFMSCIFNNSLYQSRTSASPLSLTPGMLLTTMTLDKHQAEISAECTETLCRTTNLFRTTCASYSFKTTERYSVLLRKWTDSTSTVKWLLQVIEHLAGFQYSRWEEIWGCNPWMDLGIALSPLSSLFEHFQ